MRRCSRSASDDGRLHLVHNGEIYNYRELRTDLRARGHRSAAPLMERSHLRQYREWGERCVERFNGMWALAIWDRRARAGCSARRTGRRQTFYYRLGGGRFEFASELKAFAADSTQPLRPNARVVREYLEQRTSTTPKRRSSRASCASHLAHSLTFDRRGLRSKRYWRLEPRERRSMSRTLSRALPRFDPTAAAERRAGRHGALGASTRPRSQSPSTTC